VAREITMHAPALHEDIYYLCVNQILYQVYSDFVERRWVGCYLLQESKTSLNRICLDKTTSAQPGHQEYSETNDATRNYFVPLDAVSGLYVSTLLQR